MTIARATGLWSHGVYPHRIENVAELVGEPGHEGQWFGGDGELWLGLPRGETEPPPLFVASPIALVEGLQGLSNVRWEGISFELSSRGPQPTKPYGYVDIQAGNYQLPLDDSDALPGVDVTAGGVLSAVGGVAAAVGFRGAHGVVVSNCRFSRLGGSGLWFGAGSRDCTVHNSSFHDVSGAAVQVGSWAGPDASNVSLHTAGITVADNLITDVATEYHGCAAITLGYCRDTVVSHNAISSIPYTGAKFPVFGGSFLMKNRLFAETSLGQTPANLRQLNSI